MHCNKHVVKMILESAQMLSTAHRILDGNSSYTTPYFHSFLYKSTHINHPSSIWTRSSSSNYKWLYSLFLELCNEYTFRYKKIHKSYTKLNDFLIYTPTNIPSCKFSTKFTSPPQAMPDEFKNPDPIVAYRNYYQSKQYKFKMEWSGRKIPEWFTLYNKEISQDQLESLPMNVI